MTVIFTVAAMRIALLLLVLLGVVACALDTTGVCYENLEDGVAEIRLAQVARKYSRVYVYTDDLLSIFEEGVLVKTITSYTYKHGKSQG